MRKLYHLYACRMKDNKWDDIRLIKRCSTAIDHTINNHQIITTKNLKLQSAVQFYISLNLSDERGTAATVVKKQAIIN
jgi:hypothetical protein